MLHTDPLFHLSNEWLMALSSANSHVRMERDENGNLIIMSPSGSRTGRFQNALAAELYLWSKQCQNGSTFDSQTGFLLPDMSVRSPDACWVAKGRWEALEDAQKDGFPPLCPDFVVEVVSPSDSLKEQKEKMLKWISNGCHLGLIIHPEVSRYWVFMPDLLFEETFEKPFKHDFLPGLLLDFRTLPY